ncbi:hypothetical protein BS47DRAFT_1490001 [Hydnum rufescens UP504]|uniref:Uncharacterized protein n=1 Tax=Hydnum rufescens UP504 TaxID=1448309 RepID=A0A9P6DK37_9AGAM|nr:hypothetical protein BS47DRAFT_1490001 [Hydnum rufescens UP504]
MVYESQFLRPTLSISLCSRYRLRRVESLGPPASHDFIKFGADHWFDQRTQKVLDDLFNVRLSSRARFVVLACHDNGRITSESACVSSFFIIIAASCQRKFEPSHACIVRFFGESPWNVAFGTCSPAFVNVYTAGPFALVACPCTIAFGIVPPLVPLQQAHAHNMLSLVPVNVRPPVFSANLKFPSGFQTSRVAAASPIVYKAPLAQTRPPGEWDSPGLHRYM